METQISDQQNKGSNDRGKAGTCGTNSTFNFVVGTIALITGIVLAYISYTRFIQ